MSPIFRFDQHYDLYWSLILVAERDPHPDYGMLEAQLVITKGKILSFGADIIESFRSEEESDRLFKKNQLLYTKRQHAVAVPGTHQEFLAILDAMRIQDPERDVTRLKDGDTFLDIYGEFSLLARAKKFGKNPAIVQTKRDERLWRRAVNITKKRFKKKSKDDFTSRQWAYTVGVFKKMKGESDEREDE